MSTDSRDDKQCESCYGRGHVTAGSYNLAPKTCPDCGGSGYETTPSHVAQTESVAVPKAEYEALRQLQFYIRADRPNMVAHFLEELDKAEQQAIPSTIAPTQAASIIKAQEERIHDLERELAEAKNNALLLEEANQRLLDPEVRAASVASTTPFIASPSMLVSYCQDKGRREQKSEWQVAWELLRSAEVPLCDGHASSWFTERNHLKGDHGCVVCAFTPSATPRSEDPGTVKILTALVERAYGIFTASGVLRVAEQDPDSNDPIVAWASDVRSILYRNKPAAIDDVIGALRRADGGKA